MSGSLWPGWGRRCLAPWEPIEQAWTGRCSRDPEKGPRSLSTSTPLGFRRALCEEDPSGCTPPSPPTRSMRGLGRGDAVCARTHDPGHAWQGVVDISSGMRCPCASCRPQGLRADVARGFQRRSGTQKSSCSKAAAVYEPRAGCRPSQMMPKRGEQLLGPDMLSPCGSSSTLMHEPETPMQKTRKSR